jgi:protein-S-isoprenylcysteine O-methyltransferase Ste14
MTTFTWLILAFWIVFLVLWAVSAFGAKRTIGPRRREKALMLARFPTQYAAYRQRTKMLVPFVL